MLRGDEEMNKEDVEDPTEDAIRVAELSTAWLLDDLDYRLMNLQKNAYERGVADGQKQALSSGRTTPGDRA